MIRVCAIANRLNGPFLNNYLALERSLIKAKLPFYLHMEAQPWQWKRKVDWELELASAHPKDQFVFIDAFDYLFVGDPDELQALLDRQSLLFSTDADDIPWPYSHYAKFYDKRRPRLSKWCWINGSGPAGSGEAISEAIRYGQLHYEWDERGTDQTFWSNVYLDGYGELDQACDLTQSLYHCTNVDLAVQDSRLFNLQTKSKPQFIHASGRSWHMIPEECIPAEEECKP